MRPALGICPCDAETLPPKDLSVDLPPKKSHFPLIRVIDPDVVHLLEPVDAASSVWIAELRAACVLPTCYCEFFFFSYIVELYAWSI